MTESVLEYLDTDLVCYRADHPPELIQMQADVWNKPLAWFERKFGAQLQTTQKLEALEQPDNAHKAVRKHVEALDNNHFTVLQLVTAMSGSLVLALAFTEGAMTGDDVFNASRVEEKHKGQIYDEARYGPDPAQEKKDKAFMRDLEAAQKFLELLK